MQVLLNQQYLIDFESNEIAVIREEERLHLEPRLMQVLEILVERPGTLVSREELIERVWENYGGADEALTQAISHLRKALDDQRKSIIVTVPKKGYKLMANISSPSESSAASGPSSSSNDTRGYLRAIAIAAIALLTLLILVLFLFFTSGTSTPQPDEATAPPTPVETPAPENSSEREAPVAPPAENEK